MFFRAIKNEEKTKYRQQIKSVKLPFEYIIKIPNKKTGIRIAADVIFNTASHCL